MSYEQIKEFIPWIIGTVSTLLALKKDAIQASFSKNQNKLELKSTNEDIEEKQLNNVEKEIRIYRELLDDVQNRHKEVVGELNTQIENLKEQVLDLEDFIKEQKKYMSSIKVCDESCTRCECKEKKSA